MMLLAELGEAKREWLAGKAHPALPRDMPPVLRTLMAFWSYLEASPSIQTDPTLAIPLRRLLDAVYDLSKGLKPALFEPVHPPQSRPPKRIAQTNLMAVVALAVDELHASGTSLGEAARLVRRAIETADPGLEVPYPLTDQTVREWRNLLHANSPKAPRDALTRYHSPLPAEAGNSPQDRAKWLICQIKHAPNLRFG
jgi:hypothetical protein